MNNLTGQSLGRYHILEPLGEGGMATVYKAYDTRLETDVAVKFIRTDVLPQNAVERTLKRFEREAKSLARLTHPNIVKVTDYGEHDGAPYLVLVYLPGGTLKNRMGSPMPWREAIRLLLPIANALEYAHEHKVVHRDVKPANILLTENGQPMLTDFGIAKILEMEEGHTLTGTGMGVGTPEYMSPEQGMGREVDGRADIYSMGIILYELITGRKPYTADTPMAVVVKHMTDPLPRPHQYVRDIPEDVEKVLIKSLAKDPANRYPDAGAFASALEKLLVGESKSIRSTPVLAEKKNIEPDLETRDIYLTEESAETSKQIGKKVNQAGEEPSKRQDRSSTAGNSKWFWGLGGIAVAIFLFFLGQNIAGRTTKPVEATAVTTEATMPVNTVTPGFEIGSTMVGRDGMTLVFVPAGEFEMGSELGNGNEKPVHTVNLNAYWIDRTEVTNKQYAACVADGGCAPPTENKSYLHSTYYGNTEYDDYPVIYVDWNKAQAYCAWAGRRLPTEAEWEKAARGTDGRIYPWGNTPPSEQLVNYGMNAGDTTKAGALPSGASIYGALNMAGNVWEWVSDWYDKDYYQVSPAENPRGPGSGDGRVLRSGSWVSKIENIYSASRLSDDPSSSKNIYGFRCAIGISQ